MNRQRLIAGLMMLVLAGAARADDMPRQITVTGQGYVETVPDLATISLGVTNEAVEAKVAMDATSEAVARILERMQAMGLEPRDIQTQRLSLHPVWSNTGGTRDERAHITGFSASNMVMVRVRDLSGLGGILDSVIDGGANDFNGLRFSVQDPDPLEEEARRAAVADAMARAQTLAEAAGVSLGPVLSISENGGMRAKPLMMDMASREASGVPIAAGELRVEASVTMVFAIAD